MSDPVLLIDLGAEALPEITPVVPQTGTWMTAVYAPPPLVPPTALMATPIADAAVLTWASTPASQTVIETAPNTGTGGAPGAWTEYKRTAGSQETLPLPAGQKRWVRLKALRNGASSAWSASLLAEPVSVATYEQVQAAIAAAADAQDTADGAIVTFYEPSPPLTSESSEGDIWFDTDDGNKIYTRRGASWVQTQDSEIAQAINAAAGAQATADGKVKTFFSNSEPTATGVGDLWFNSVSKKLFRWGGSTWTQNIGDVTIDQLAGSGVNLLWDEYTDFSETQGVPPIIQAHGNDIYCYISTAINYGSLAFRCDTDYASATIRFTPSGTDFNVYLPPGKYIVSTRTNSSSAYAGANTFDVGVQYSDGKYVFSANSGAVANGNGQKTFLLDTSAFAGDNYDCHFFVRPNRAGLANAGVLYLDHIMIETQIGNLLQASRWVPGPNRQQALSAIAAAAAAQDTADGKIETFLQTTMPNGASLGDLWFDTDDGKKQYRHNGSTFVVAQDTAIGDAILSAAGAQATADGKVNTFYASTAPSGTRALGDLWYNTTTKFITRWNGSTWISVGDITADKTAGSSTNVLWAEYCTYRTGQALPPLHATAAPASLYISSAFGVSTGGSWLAVTMTVGGAWSFRFAKNTSDFNLSLTPGKQYIISLFGTVSGPGDGLCAVELGIVGSSGSLYDTDDIVLLNDNNKHRYSVVLDLRSASVTDCNCHLFLRSRGTVVACTAYFDGFMIEEIKGNIASAGAFQPGPSRVGVYGSGVRLADQRNIPKIASDSVRNATALSATSAGAITVNAHSVRYGSFSVAYSAVTNAVTGKAANSTWLIYCLDPYYDGGARTWYAAGNPDALYQLGDDIYIAGQITIPASGSSSGGGSGGGSNPGGWCVDVDSFLPDGTLAGRIEPGAPLPCYDQIPDAPGIVFLPVQRNRIATVECIRMITLSGASIVASLTTPMTLRDGGCVMLPDMLDRDALVLRMKWLGRALSALGARRLMMALIRSRALRPFVASLQWERVVGLHPDGRRPVAKISVRDQCYFAGETMSAFIATHNLQANKP